VLEQPAGRHCLLQVAACGPGTVVTGSTGGLLAAWAVGPAAGETLRPLGELSVHQSGVNCLTVRPDGSSGAHLLLTGGDDGALVLSRLTLGGGGAELAQVWSSALQGGPAWRPAAQVTSLQLIGQGLAVSLGVDQRLAVWRLQEDRLHCLAVRCGAVADPQGLEVWQEEGEVLCMAAGVGMELTAFHELPS
jgi:hypothetical protein